MTSPGPHIRLRTDEMGGHTHVQVFTASRGGADAVHGHNGTLVFTNLEFVLFRQLVDAGQMALGGDVVEWAQGGRARHRPAPTPARRQTEPGDPS